jgi:transmembrane sensor
LFVAYAQLWRQTSHQLERGDAPSPAICLNLTETPVPDVSFMRQDAAYAVSLTVKESGMERRSHARRKTLFTATFITSAALLSPAAFMSAWVHAEPLSTEVYSTRVGEVRPCVLGERMGARMNTGTYLTVTRSPELLEVSLDHGEALFDLAGESAGPLRVVAGNVVVNTHGARFSVRMHDSRNIDIVMSAGQLTIGTITMRANQLARVSPAGMALRDLTDAEVNRRLEWLTGNITFTGETLAEAVAEFNRYNTSKLVIADRTIGSIAIGGSFRSTDVESFVEALRPIGVRRMKSDVANADDSIRLVGSKGKD